MYLDGLFDLIDIVKNKFRKKSLDEELDEYLDSEMPGELDKVTPYTKGIHTEEQFESVRKQL